ncbi:MAG: TolC family protein [Proteobacteria bacterium]|nr:TolC family protein [Pseudomonadota bacterium]
MRPRAITPRRYTPATRWLGAALLVSMAASLALAGPARAVTLEEVLVGLLATHPQIEADVNRVSSAEQRIRGVTSQYYPRVDLSSDFGVENVDTAVRRADGLAPFRRGRERATLSVTQNVFDGSRKSLQRRGARFDREAARKNLETSRQNVLFEGIGAYIDVLRQTELFELVSVNERAVERQFVLENERLEAGAGLAVELLLARSRLQLAKERRVLFRGSMENALSRYRQVFGEPPHIAAMVAPSPPVDLLPRMLDEAIRGALDRNPVLASAGSLVDSARAREKAAQADYFPQFDIVGTANFEDDVNAVPGVRRDWSVLLQARWNLFNGFSTRANVAGAAFDHAAGLNDLRLVKRRVEEEVRFAWQGLETSCERRFLLENAVDISLDVLDSRRRLRDAGQETALRVLDAETEVIGSQINLAAAAFDENLSVYRMMLALGRLESVVDLGAGEAVERYEGPPPLIVWCREYASLELRDDDPSRVPTPLARDDNPFAAPGDEGPSGDDPFAAAFGDDAFDDNDGGGDGGDLFAALSATLLLDDEVSEANETPPFQFDDGGALTASDEGDELPTAFLLFDDAPSTGDAAAGAGAADLPRFDFETDEGLSRTSAAGN